MRPNQRLLLLLALIAVASMVGWVLGWWLPSPPLSAAGTLGLVYAGLRYGSSQQRQRAAHARQEIADDPAESSLTDDPADIDALVEQLLTQSRVTLLLRPQIAVGLNSRQFRRVLAALEHGMAVVPEGNVALGPLDDVMPDGRLDDHRILEHAGRVVNVDAFFLDRFPVTNQQFYQFVAAGGYRQPTLWGDAVWPAVAGFVDASGRPGPASWSQGHYPPGLERHPVVGVSWYEAMAYARWAGKRLPTDAEWVKAGAWPVQLSSTSRLQRKYPWGDLMDRSRANLWGSGPEKTVPVDEYPDGVSVGGVYQLIGNVWEWTRGAYPPGSAEAPSVEVPLKSIRGGAFDTYFDNQATCQFQSGEAAPARKPNIGFRCAVGVCDLVLVQREAPDLAMEKTDEESSECHPEEVAV